MKIIVTTWKYKKNKKTWATLLNDMRSKKLFYAFFKKENENIYVDAEFDDESHLR